MQSYIWLFEGDNCVDVAEFDTPDLLELPVPQHYTIPQMIVLAWLGEGHKCFPSNNIPYLCFSNHTVPPLSYQFMAEAPLCKGRIEGW